MHKNILILGAGGQIGTDLYLKLSELLGSDRVIASDIRSKSELGFECDRFVQLDVLKPEDVAEVIQKNDVGQVYHLAALLSAVSEQKPISAWNVNMQGLLNLLNICRDLQVPKLFWPSSIAVFGPSSPKVSTPQDTIMDPNTVYGISKLAGERWCSYYHNKYGLDVRSLRYPGLISYKAPAGGGTTDYAVDIFFKAVEEAAFTCFLKSDTRLPMMYMDDAIRGTIELMNCPADQIKIRSAYNFSGVSFTPQELATLVQKHIPEFKMDYQVDFRQAIADSWPSSIDDSKATADWNWRTEFDLDNLVSTMLQGVRNRNAVQS